MNYLCKNETIYFSYIKKNLENNSEILYHISVYKCVTDSREQRRPYRMRLFGGFLK